jgi:hypothetical protein
MRNTLLLVVLACALPMTGCFTLSLYPLYSANGTATDLQIEGRWTDVEGQDIWEIRRDGDGFVATCPTDATSEPVRMRMVRLGEYHFLDLTSRNTPTLAIEGHMFGKIWMSEGNLNVQLMSSSWLERKAKEAGLAYVELPDHQVVLTAATGDLQKFVLRYATDAEAFEEPQKLHRAATPSAR